MARRSKNQSWFDWRTVFRRLRVANKVPLEKGDRTMREETINSLAEYIDKIGVIVKTADTHQHLRWWFRGVQDAQFKLIPSVFRSQPRKGHLNLQDDERHAFRDFRLWSAGMIPTSTSLQDIYFQQQHHRLPTRLLDWTTNALIAIYFAVEGENVNKDGAVYAMDAYGFGEHEYIRFDKKKPNPNAGGFAVASDDPNSLLSVALADIIDWRKGHKPPHFIFPVRPAFTDVRMQIQRSCFTYHPPSLQELTDAENNTLCKIVIPKDDVKKGVKDQLLHLGIDHFSVFGDIDSLAKTVTGNFQLGS
jgi:FRG domain